jgi:hypothetical protein
MNIVERKSNLDVVCINDLIFYIRYFIAPRRGARTTRHLERSVFLHPAASSPDPSILIAVRYSSNGLPTRRWFRIKILAPISNTVNVLNPGNTRRLADSPLLGPLELAGLLDVVKKASFWSALLSRAFRISRGILLVACMFKDGL